MNATANVKADKKESTLKKCATLDYLAYRMDDYATRAYLHREQYKHSPNGVDAVNARLIQAIEYLGLSPEKRGNLAIAAVLVGYLAMNLLDETRQ